MLKHKGTYEIISPEDIGLERSSEAGIVLGKLRYVVYSLFIIHFLFPFVFLCHLSSNSLEVKYVLLIMMACNCKNNYLHYYVPLSR